ncbi:cyclic nucleotide-gated ion channel 1-like [Dorcoceras hygrometricum]|uniref:Cyclic nucleotide-gated ion channel 1-like n=1 Tax=Dorcoceras hygrometricum TaxID=472368 RepID=A0A2Z7D6L9_9LAMI|nr:cyclic nucleotide-gated ion channel 1-like [Dorcoceras hygrometricum]
MGIDQLKFQSVQFGYLKILQMGNTDPNNTKAGKEYESTRSVLGKWVYLVTLAMSLFDLQDVCIVIGSLATLDLPMVVDLIGIYGLKGPYCTLTTTSWFLQALSVIPRRSWGDVARRFTMIRWESPILRYRSHNGCGLMASCIPEPLRVTQVLDSRFPHGNSAQCVEHRKRILGTSTQKVGRPSPSTTRTAAAHRHAAAAVLSSCDRTCFDHCDEVTPSMDKSISLVVQADRRNRDSGRGPDWRIYRRLQFEVPISSLIGGIVIPVVDRIGGSTAAYSLKCRFPRETGRSQAPRRQQDGIRIRHRFPNSGIRAKARILQYIVA